MTFEAPKEKKFEKPLRSPHLDEKADREYDLMVEQGLAVPVTAWDKVTREHGTIEPTVHSTEEDHIPIAPPPRPGKSDEQIRQNHRDALRDRDSGIPQNFDPELNRQMLDRAKRGDFSYPPESDTLVQ